MVAVIRHTCLTCTQAVLIVYKYTPAEKYFCLCVGESGVCYYNPNPSP